MKTTITNKTKGLLTFAKALMVTLVLGTASTAVAQCTAIYGFNINTSNNGQVSFSASSSGAMTPYFEWSFGDGNTGYGYYASHTYATGTYNVCLVMQDSSSSCMDTSCFSVTVINNSTPTGGGCNAYFVAHDSLNYVFFEDQTSGSGPFTYAWNYGDGNTGTAAGGSYHSYASTGTYYVCLTVSNGAGCSSTYCDSITISSNGMSGACMGIVNPVFTAAASGPDGVFSNSPSGSGQVYTWDFGDGSQSNVAGSTTHHYTANGTYYVCLVVFDTAGTDSCQYCTNVTITDYPACHASYFIVQDSLNSFQYNLYNTSSTTVGSPYYYWDFGDGYTSTLPYPSHTYAGNGPYYLCLTIADSTGAGYCTDMYCDSLAAGRSEGITVTVVAPLTTGISEQVITTSLANFPNPFSGSTTINYTISADAAVELNIIDLLGNNVASLENSHKAAGSYSVVWNADNVAQGMYLLQMRANNSATIKKIIVNK